MKKIVYKILLVIDILAGYVFSLCSHFIFITDSYTGEVRDLFGRVQSTPPTIMRRAGIMSWAGVKWMVVDAIIMFVLILIAISLREKITYKEEKQKEE